MLLKIIKLSVFCICLFNSSYIKADSFFEPVNSTVCEEKKAGISQVDIRFDAYDKATLQAIKNNQYVKNKAQNIDDHQYNIIAYKISDTVLSDVNIKTIQDDDEKVCIELFGIINKKEVDAVFNDIVKEPSKSVAEIAQDVKEKMPNSIITPLIYIEDIVYYNNTKSSIYTPKIAELVSLEPNVLVSDNLELSDYILQPRMLMSKIEKIDDKNSRFSMSVAIEIKTQEGDIIISKQKNRYIIIDNSDNKQEIASKLLLKLIKECLKELSPSVNNLKLN
jgi:hypothetical protein